MAVSANRLELLQIADAVARDKSIDRSIVLASMEDAMQKAARSRYGQETEVRAEINPRTGEVRYSRLMLVVEQIENDATQILLADARKRNPAAQVGDWIAETLPPVEFGRIAAQSAKQVIVQKVREAERDRQYDEFKDRIGEIINGAVKRVAPRGHNHIARAIEGIVKLAHRDKLRLGAAGVAPWALPAVPAASSKKYHAGPPPRRRH